MDSVLQCSAEVRVKGAWSKEEDDLLRKCIEKYGEGKWSSVPNRAGLRRCQKSCRLRWLNYLSPGIRRGEFNHDEVDLIVRLHRLLGNRWSLIAGRIPGRTANDIRKYWNSHWSKKPKAQLVQEGEDEAGVNIARVVQTTPRVQSRPSQEFQRRTQQRLEELPEGRMHNRVPMEIRDHKRLHQIEEELDRDRQELPSSFGAA